MLWVWVRNGFIRHYFLLSTAIYNSPFASALDSSCFLLPQCSITADCQTGSGVLLTYPHQSYNAGMRKWHAISSNGIPWYFCCPYLPKLMDFTQPAKLSFPYGCSHWATSMKLVQVGYHHLCSMGRSLLCLWLSSQMVLHHIGMSGPYTWTSGPIWLQRHHPVSTTFQCHSFYISNSATV
jgi:hypothetical protein